MDFCQSLLLEVLTTFTIFIQMSAASQVCPFGWTERENSDRCYLISAGSTRYKFESLIDKCQSYGGQSLIIRDSSEKDWLMKQLQQTTSAYPVAKSWWLGITYSADHNKYLWVDGTDVQNNIVPWVAGLPGQTKGPCVTISGAGAQNADCVTWNQLLCTRPRGVPLVCDADNRWTYINGSCFKVFTDQRSWGDAKGLCALHDAQLASVLTLMEQSSLWDAARNNQPQIGLWTGLHAPAAQVGEPMGLWWLHGQDMLGAPLNNSDVFWKDGQPPVPLARQTAMVIDGSLQRRLRSWTMDKMQAHHGYACQKPPGVCEDGWMTHQTECYKIFLTPTGWAHANHTCTSIGGQLIVLANPSDQAFVDELVPQIQAAGFGDFWIGLSDEGDDSGWFKWSDGTAVSANSTHWALSRPPTNTGGKADCGFIRITEDNQHRWHMTSDCLLPRPYVCSIAVNTPVRAAPTTPPPSVPLQCEVGWSLVSGSCFYFADMDRNWAASRRACQDLGGDLATVRTQAVQSFINDHLLHDASDYWMGASDTESEGHWIWVDGTKMQGFLHWSASEPNNMLGGEDCGSLWGTRPQWRGEWNDQKCTHLQRYLCQKQPSHVNSVTLTPTTTMTQRALSSKCGPNWEERPNSAHCYQFHEETRKYQEARRVCQDNNSTLVSIVDNVELGYLTGRVASMPTSLIWIGATDSDMEGGWHWEDRSPFAFVNWNPGEPNNLDQGEDCASMSTRNSRWSDFNCNLQLAFVCKKLETASSTSVPSTTPLPLDMQWTCPSGYLGFHYQCYKVFTAPSAWSDAQTHCRSQGGELASLADAQHNAFVFSILPAGRLQAGTWLGMSELQSRGSFRWSDMSPVTFTNWRVNNPLAFPKPSCVIMTKDTGSWVNGPCDGFANYVCQLPMRLGQRTTIPPSQIGCPMHSVGYQSYCYKVVTTPDSWQAAEAHCARSHIDGVPGHLATINSLQIQSVVMAELDVTAAGHYWIGLWDAGQPGSYVWSSGRTVLFTAWDSSPTGKENLSCVAMQTARPVGLWQALNCSLTRPYVCEYLRRGYTLPHTTTPGTTTTPAPCPADWLGFNNNCYKVFRERSAERSWGDSREFCLSLGSDLASIQDDSVNNFFRDTLLRIGYDNFWIGLSDAVKEGVYAWSDGTAAVYDKWSRGEPNNAGGNEDCVEYNRFTNAWNDNSCYITNPFICSLPRGKPLITTASPPTTTPVPTCDNTEWIADASQCYFVSPVYGSNSVKTWFDARRFCLNNGAHLVSILSQSENSFLLYYLKLQSRSDREYWTGFNKIGLHQFQWADGSASAYSNWATGEPNDGTGGEACGSLHSVLGKWNDRNCNTELHFICERGHEDGISPITPAPTPLIVGGCPADFNGFGNLCYQLKGTVPGSAVGYMTARDTCRNMSAAHPVDIASITNYGQQAFLTTLLEAGNKSAFIGLNALKESRQYVWHDNQEVTVTYWGPGQPSSTHSFGLSRESCVVMSVLDEQFGTWNDVNCDSVNAYFCQTRKDPQYPIITHNIGGDCGDGYSHYRDSCYSVYDTNQAWTDAERTCILDGGHLSSIRDAREAAFVDVLISERGLYTSFWIGLKFTQTTNEYSWVDGWPVTLTPWGKGQPQIRGVGACVMTTNGSWNDSVCNETYPFVCKVSSVTPPPSTSAAPGFCSDPSWTSFGAHCYYAAPREAKSWPEAKYLCGKQGMDLVSIHSSEELAFVQQLVKAAVTTSRYGYLSSMATRVWLGLQRTVQGSFSWSDDSPYDFFTWNDGEPNNSGQQEDCAELLADSGRWNDLACIGSNRGYVCKAHKTLPSTTKQNSINTTKLAVLTTLSAGLEPNKEGANTTKTNQQGRNTVQIKKQGENTAKPQTLAPSSSLSSGQLAGVILGILAFIIVVIVIIYIVRGRYGHLSSGKGLESASGFDNALYCRKYDKDPDLTPNQANGLPSTPPDLGPITFMVNDDTHS